MLTHELAVASDGLPLDLLLGEQVITTIPDRGVSHERAAELVAAEGLDAALLPDGRKPIDVAQHACRSVESRRAQASSSGDSTLEVAVDRVRNSSSEVVYQVTRRVRDSARRIIEHEKAMRVTFDAARYDRGTDPWAFEALSAAGDFETMRPLEEAIRLHFAGNLGLLPGAKVRGFVRDYLSRRDLCGATNMRRGSGGVYFVPIEHRATLDALQRIVGDLYGDDADFDRYPMANSASVRDAIAKHHGLDVQGQATELLTEISERLKSSRLPREDFIANKLRQRRELGQHRKRMATLLDRQLAESDTAFDLLDAQLEKLLAARPSACGTVAA